MRRARRRRSAQIIGLGRLLCAVATRPRLWPAAMGALRRLVPHRWWLRPPFLPLPSRDYLRFRQMTALGSDGSALGAFEDLAPEDLIEWLQWCRRWPAVSAP